ncbi:MAG: CoA transferase [Actinomycetota bacterium]|nr:CoA transferase [Actinomycetota bacterium]
MGGGTRGRRRTGRLGADVIKVETTGGDPMRHLFRPPPDSPAAHAPSFSAVNRGKRSVELDLATTTGRDVREALLSRADVFVTNLRPGALERLGLAPALATDRHPRLVYCSVTAYGWEGPEREAAGYDLAAFFGRAGVLHQLTPPGSSPAPFMNGLGDMFTAMSAVAGVLAAVNDRHHTGRGRFVEASLLRSGMWSLAGEIGMAANGAAPKPVADRNESRTPLFNVYRTSDDHWFVLVGVEADRHLPAVIAAVGRPELLDDERFADARAVGRNRAAFIAELDAEFVRRPLAEWSQRFAEHDVWWGPVQTPLEVAADAQAEAAGAWVQVAGPDGVDRGRSVGAPIRFDGETRGRVTDAPDLGQHTEEILAEIEGKR